LKVKFFNVCIEHISSQRHALIATAAVNLPGDVAHIPKLNIRFVLVHDIAKLSGRTR
jgi:hypothetical protein